MNKIIFLFVLIILTGCSLNKNSKFWSTSEKINEDTNTTNTSKSEEILKKSLVYEKEFNQNLKIKVEGNFNTNKQIDYLTNNNSRVNFNGKLKTSFGEIGKLGAKSKGIVIETIPKASVISPYEGEIVFAAPFRNYGNLLIISYGNGYHILLSGMESIDGNVGKWIMAGEPVGKMGKIKRDETPELYMELRKNGEPINPKKWIAFNHMKVRG